MTASLIKFSGVVVAAILVVGAFLLAPTVMAQATIDIGNPLIPESFTGEGKTSATPADTVGFVQERLGQLLAVMFGLLAALSIVPIVTGGINLIISQGEAEKVKKGKQSLLWGILGFLIGVLGIGLYLWFIEFVLPGTPGSTPGF